jgi:hypothetical protein
MKKQLLILFSTVLISVSSISAQTKVWDFGNNLGGFWPLTGSGIGTIGAGTSTVIDKLGLFSNDPLNTGIANFGAITANVAAFSDGYTSVNRFQMNGGGGGTAGNLLPTQRYLYFNVDGACTVTVWFKTGSNGTTRKVMCTNGVTLLGSGTSNDSATGGTNADLVIFTATISAADAAVGKIYIYGDTTANNLYKIQVTGANVVTPTLTSDNFISDSSINVFTNGNQVSVANVKSDSKIEVYNMLGSLVKTMNTSSDFNFNIETAGFYIVNVTSSEGKKSIKISIK